MTMTAPTPEATLEDIRREAIKTLLDLKGDSVMNLLFQYGAWAVKQTQTIKLDYGNLNAWLRKTPGRLSEQKQMAFAAFLGLRENQLEKGIVHSWQPMLSAFALQKHGEIIRSWFSSTPITVWNLGARPELQQRVRMVCTEDRMVRISAVDSVWAWLLSVLDIAESSIRELPRDFLSPPLEDHQLVNEPLDFEAFKPLFIINQRLDQMKSNFNPAQAACWQELITACEQAGITPDQAHQKIFKSAHKPLDDTTCL